MAVRGDTGLSGRAEVLISGRGRWDVIGQTQRKGLETRTAREVRLCVCPGVCGVLGGMLAVFLNDSPPFVLFCFAFVLRHLDLAG